MCNCQSIGDDIQRAILGSPDSISLDAWNKQKVVFDKSLFKSKFTHNIPDKDWVLPPDEVSGATIVSENGQLVMTSGTTLGAVGRLKSRRHPSYQSNRGILYSTALIIPNVADTGIRRWGIYFKDDSTPYHTGVFFELVDGVLKGKQITTFDGVVTGKGKEITIDYSDLVTEDGHLRALFDIQGQWRGMGDFFFNLNLKKRGTIRNLGIDEPDLKVSIINPSLPVWFEVENTDGATSLQIIAGCVDISTEGGGSPNYRTQVIESKTPGTITNVEVPTLIGYIPNDFQGQHNSRDSILRRAILAAFDKSYVKIYTTRDKSAFGHTAFGDVDGETDFLWANADQSSIKFYNAALDEASKFDPTKANIVYGDFSDIGDTPRPHWPHDEDDIVISHGDYIVVTGEKNQAASAIKVYSALSFDEEI